MGGGENNGLAISVVGRISGTSLGGEGVSSYWVCVIVLVGGVWVLGVVRFVERCMPS